MLELRLLTHFFFETSQGVQVRSCPVEQFSELGHGDIVGMDEHHNSQLLAAGVVPGKANRDAVGGQERTIACRWLIQIKSDAGQRWIARDDVLESVGRTASIG